MAVNVKEATKSAIGYLHDVIPSAKNARLEEVERAAGFWRITLSFQLPGPPGGPQEIVEATLGNYVGQREYKVFEVDSETGEVAAMRIREFSE